MHFGPEDDAGVSAPTTHAASQAVEAAVQQIMDLAMEFRHAHAGFEFVALREQLETALRAELTSPQVAAEGDEKRDAVMRHDFPALQQFHSKHAMGPLAAPSCLCCGRSTQGVEIGVQHLELPGVVICEPCKTAASRSPAAGVAGGVDAVTESEREELHRLRALINNPQTAEFLPAVQAEAAHQRQKWGEPHDRQKSAENWFWLVGYLSGKALRAAITGDTFKAKHHTISSAAALCNWFEAIARDESGAGIGADNDIKPTSEGGREGTAAPNPATSQGRADEGEKS
jgi:hypothetical protein